MEWDIGLMEIFHSLQIRLTIGFASILLIAISVVSGYSAYVTRNEITNLRNEIEDVKNIRAEELVKKTYEATNNWQDVQYAVQQVGTLFGWHVIIENSNGNIVADSHNLPPNNKSKPRSLKTMQKRPIILNDKNLGWMLINRKPSHNAIIPQPVSQRLTTQSTNKSSNLEELNKDSERIISEVLEVVEPPLTDLQTTFQNALIIAGSTSIIAGIFLVSLFTRQSLLPVKDLNKIAKKLGSGNFSHRVEVQSDDEIGQLSKTFNTMAHELENLQKERRQMTANVAHELRTPLTNIRGYLEAIKDKILPPDNKNISMLYDQTLHLTNLVDDLRILSMVETESLSLKLEKGDLGKLIESSVQDFYPRSKVSGVKILLDIQNKESMNKIFFDRTRMKQIIGNLLENALSYSSEGDEIKIVSKKGVDNQYEIKIIDEGLGIPENDLGKIFDEFFRVDKSRSRQTGGAGLGLAIVKKLVIAHKGTVTAESKINQGTTFTINLPLEQ